MVPDLVKIGKLTRLHGIKGAMILHVGTGEPPLFKKAGAFFVGINGVPTPFFPQFVKQSGKHLILHFDSVNDMESANKLLNLEVFVEKKALMKQKKETDVKGYELIDKQKGKLGIVNEIIEMPGQKMLSVLVGSNEVLLPYAAELIEKIDAKTKTIYYNAPDNLIDIYLG